MGQAESAIGAEKNDTAATAEAAVEIGHGFAGGEFGSGSDGDAIHGPLAEHELHDWFAPSGERNGCGEIIGVAATADKG